MNTESDFDCKKGFREDAKHTPTPIEKLNATLFEFAKKHHDVCGECEGSGKIYNNADPTSGQWVACPYAEAIRKAEGKS